MSYKQARLAYLLLLDRLSMRQIRNKKMISGLLLLSLGLMSFGCKQNVEIMADQIQSAFRITDCGPPIYENSNLYTIKFNYDLHVLHENFFDAKTRVALHMAVTNHLTGKTDTYDFDVDNVNRINPANTLVPVYLTALGHPEVLLKGFLGTSNAENREHLNLKGNLELIKAGQGIARFKAEIHT